MLTSNWYRLGKLVNSLYFMGLPFTTKNYRTLSVNSARVEKLHCDDV